MHLLSEMEEQENEITASVGICWTIFPMLDSREIPEMES